MVPLESARSLREQKSTSRLFKEVLHEFDGLPKGGADGTRPRKLLVRDVHREPYTAFTVGNLRSRTEPHNWSDFWPLQMAENKSP